MVQVGRRLGLVVEPGDLPLVQHGRKRQHLQRHAPAKRNLPRLVDDAHSPAADLADDRVVAQLPLREVELGPASGPVRAEPLGGLVKKLQPIEAAAQRPGQVGMAGDKIVRAGRRSPLQISEVALQNVRQPALRVRRKGVDPGRLGRGTLSHGKSSALKRSRI